MEAAKEQKHAKYADLAEECKEAGWTAITKPCKAPSKWDAGAWSGPQWSARSPTWDAWQQGVGNLSKNWKRRQMMKKSSFWLWLRRTQRVAD